MTKVQWLGDPVSDCKTSIVNKLACESTPQDMPLPPPPVQPPPPVLQPWDVKKPWCVDMGRKCYRMAAEAIRG